MKFLMTVIKIHYIFASAAGGAGGGCSWLGNIIIIIIIEYIDFD